MRRLISTIAITAGAVLISSPVALARQTAPATKAAAPKGKLPAPIEAAFKQAYPNATIKNVSKEKEKGQDIYEVESVDGGRRRDLNYKPDGTVVSFEEEIAQADLPAPVAAAVKARYPKATFALCEKVMENKTTNYEIQLKGAAVKEVILSPDGAWISPKADSK
jgi:hypothetical protein